MNRRRKHHNKLTNVRIFRVTANNYVFRKQKLTEWMRANIDPETRYRADPNKFNALDLQTAQTWMERRGLNEDPHSSAAGIIQSILANIADEAIRELWKDSMAEFFQKRFELLFG